MLHMKKIDGAWAMVICALGWSLAGVFIKYVNINSFALAGFRSTFAFITIAAFSKRLPRFVIRTKSDDDDKGCIDKKRTFYLWMAALCYAATMILFCLCNKLTYSANAVLLQYTNPIWIILLGPFFLGEKNSRSDYISIGGVVIGMLLFFADTIFGNVLNGSGQNVTQVAQPEFADTIVLGNILALVSGVTFGLTTIFQRKQQLLASESNSGDTNTTSDAFMISQIITAVFGLIFVFTTDNGIPDAKSLLFLVLLGVFQMGIPNIAYGIGIKKVRALSAALITMLEPLMNPIWVLIFVHEIPSVFSIIGGIIILGFILYQGYSRHHHQAA